MNSILLEGMAVCYKTDSEICREFSREFPDRLALYFVDSVRKNPGNFLTESQTNLFFLFFLWRAASQGSQPANTIPY